MNIFGCGRIQQHLLVVVADNAKSHHASESVRANANFPPLRLVTKLSIADLKKIRATGKKVKKPLEHKTRILDNPTMEIPRDYTNGSVSNMPRFRRSKASPRREMYIGKRSSSCEVLSPSSQNNPLSSKEYLRRSIGNRSFSCDNIFDIHIVDVRPLMPLRQLSVASLNKQET
jgi:hypothetical protein